MILGGRKLTIQRKGRVQDGQGGWREDWTGIGSERGKLRPASAREREIAGQQQAVVSHVSYLRKGANVKLGDRLLLDDVGYEVIAVREPGLAGKHLEIDLNEVQRG